MDTTTLTGYLPALLDAVDEASAAVMRFYDAAEEVRWYAKRDASPVTEADLAADAIILRALANLAPEIPAISEETFDGTFDIGNARSFWLVDPIDGTKEFLGRTGEFTVNIGLIVERRPVLGVIAIPVTGEVYWGMPGHGAWRRHKGRTRTIRCRMVPEEGLTVASSRYHGNPARLEQALAGMKVAKTYRRGSSYKFCDIAYGLADYYPCFGSISEWDTAAGHALVLGAGGRVTAQDGGELMYGKEALRNPPFVVRGRDSSLAPATGTA